MQLHLHLLLIQLRLIHKCKITIRTSYTRLLVKLRFTLLGALIGGAIGQNVTKNMPDGATAGAIIGGILGNQNSTASGGSKTVCQTETRYTEESKTVYSHSTITFVYEGKRYSVNFKK